MPTDLDGHPLVDGDLTLLPWRHVMSLPGVRDDLVAASNDPEMVRWTTVPHPYTAAHADEFLSAPTPAQVAQRPVHPVADHAFATGVHVQKSP